MNNITKEISPRPDFYRENWISLNGEWSFEFDDNHQGMKEEWYNKHTFSKKIQVPYCYQSKLSGIHDLDNHDTMWYQKVVNITENMKDKRLWLNFGAVDYKAIIWINGKYAGKHSGGHTPFSIDITEYLYMNETEFIITVLCKDSFRIDQPRGKQYWGIKPERCWYTATSGIWQSVWLEMTQGTKLERALITPDIDTNTAEVKLKLSESISQYTVFWTLKFNEKNIKSGNITDNGQLTRFMISIENEDPIDNLVHLWSPDSPNLYNLHLELYSGDILLDRVETYFGMRSIKRRGHQILLNNSPLYQRLVLNQGYWEESLLTPPSEEAIIRDMEAVKAMGFNGIRLHQKIEDPRLLYYADVMGILVWSEMPSNYEFNEDGSILLLSEYYEMIMRDYNHPSIISWIPFNESWGIRNVMHNKKQQNFAESIYQLTKSIDDTRLVSTNDGWEIIKTDFIGIHDYEASGEVFYEKYKDIEDIKHWTVASKMILSDKFEYHGEPIIMSEFGGIAFENEDNESWGYHGKVTGKEEFLRRFKGLFDAIAKLPYVSGYCYTQLTDVQQEQNGLLYENRTPKIEIEDVRKIILGL